ncbi:MAG: O-antigen ligase family protein [Anaerolineales bacterium]|nr:O-antigen ligase family protein [Chloroflexota bacterium]MBL6980673.1 O-antigen ligase family protein [Anaerolineales bacterium]
MVQIFIWLDRLHWLWLILATPFLLFPNPERSPAMLVVPATWILHWFLSRRKNSNSSNNSPTQQDSRYPLPLTPLNGSLLLLAIMVLVSIWATYDIELSLPKLSGMVLGFGVFFAVVREGSNSKGWWLGLLVFLAMGFGVANLGFLGTRWTTTKLDFLNPITARFPMIFSNLPGAIGGFHPNEVAGALTWVLPIFVTLSVYFISPQTASRKYKKSRTHSMKGNKYGTLLVPISKPWHIWVARISVWFVTLFIGGVFILTQSRSGYLALAITFPILLFISLPGKLKWIFLGLIVVTGIILGFALSKEDLFIARDWLMGSGITSANTFSLNTLEGRIEIWSRAIYGLQDFSFTGMGMNTFREVVHVIYPLFSVTEDKDIGYGYAHAHNEFLQAGLDLGIPGMIAFIALNIGALWMLMRLRRVISWRSHQHTDMINSPQLFIAIVLGLAGGMAAHLVYGLTDAVALGAKPGILFWILLSLIAGLYNQMFRPVVQRD